MHALRFGIEIETVRLTCAAVAAAVARAIPGAVVTGSTTVRTSDGREWKCVPDGSLSGGYHSCEIVSPILTVEDLPFLQKLVREVRKAGARADSTCGIHIHVDGAQFDARAAVNLIRLVARQEQVIEKALVIQPHRRARYCRQVSDALLASIEAAKPKTMEGLRALWYGRPNVTPSRYDQSRYNGLNLNSLFFRGTCEFRWFEGTLHAGEVKAYVQLVLAMASRALTAKSARAARKAFKETSAKFDMRVLLHYLGMRGDAFSVAREHLTKRLPGSGVAPSRRVVRVTETAPETARSA